MARPVVLVSRDAHLETRGMVLAAPVTARVRGLESEVRLGPEDGLLKPCAVNASSVALIAKTRLLRRIGALSPAKRGELDAALRFSLGLD
jgi:mRNA-degrading endonuclease toxin of MazEF toxin-antitoxin module